MSCRIKILFAISLLLSLHLRASAHNGKTFVAHRASRITIDGDLSDWPDDIESHPIATQYLFDGKPDNECEQRVHLRAKRNQGGKSTAQCESTAGRNQRNQSH